MIKIKKLERPNLKSPMIRSYLPEVLKGLRVTSRHFFANLFGRRETPTIQYPEQTVEYSRTWRGLHRLMRRDDGTIRCVACMCCSTNCPAECITIEASESDDKSKEKFPVRFDINLLLCIYCGLCVEACPCDAIRMDAADHARPTYTREESIITRDELLGRGVRSTAKQGGMLR